MKSLDTDAADVCCCISPGFSFDIEYLIVFANVLLLSALVPFCLFGFAYFFLLSHSVARILLSHLYPFALHSFIL